MSESAVLVAGSVHIDRMVQVTRLPVAGETVIATGSWLQLGGKAANQAMACASLTHTTLAACVGNDDNARHAKSTLVDAGVHCELQVSGTLPTGSSVALLDGSGENVGVVLPGANDDFQAEVVSTCGAGLPTLLVCQWETAAPALHTLLAWARTQGVPTLINAAPWHNDPAYRDTLRLADHVVVNAVEAQSWTGMDPQRRSPHLPFGHPSVVVTLGAGGALHYVNGMLITDLVAPLVRARSTHGAGDHFVGVLAAQMALGQAVTDALRRAIESAAQFVVLLRKHPSKTLP